MFKAIADNEKIEVSDKEVDDKINIEILKHYKTIEEAAKNVDLTRLKDYFYGIIRNEKTINQLKKFLAD